MSRRVRICLTVLLTAACAGCSIFGSDAKPRTTPVDAEASKALDETGDLLVAGDNRVFSVNSKTNEAREVLQTEQPVSSLSYTGEHMAITVFQPSDPKASRGFYLRDSRSDSFTMYPTPGFSPKLSYIYGDLMFLASADKTAQKDGDYAKVGIYQLKEHKWVKEWMLPGGIEDITGRGKDLWLVTSNNATTSSNLYKVDLETGEWGKLIAEARRYPLDQVEADSGGDIYMMISQRNKTEWSNKIYRWDPQEQPYELAHHFVSNTRPYSYAMQVLNGKMLIARFDATGAHPDIEKPLSVLDLKTRKQTHLAWDHRPVALDKSGDEFVALGEDGAVAFVKPGEADKPDREMQVPGLRAAKCLAVKR
ncbi:hypothetical protein C8Z91_06560 [Paenibacillus elgii]|uniref:WD40 repeat domain-containing protein n=1 Tax=Paenibacillus elgii TaxID=189691 RepID=A0A2T6G7N2_9BACL|nr:hypothetical protein [Paenibacillus elgii]PUA40153.1 hypothetical protein C8Z91_06560 [Paenibacillus elgii]